jgi:hypothetical protein
MGTPSGLLAPGRSPRPLRYVFSAGGPSSAGGPAVQGLKKAKRKEKMKAKKEKKHGLQSLEAASSSSPGAWRCCLHETGPRQLPQQTARRVLSVP